MAGRRLVIVGAKENAEIAHEYFTHDSPHTVVAFAVEEAYLEGTDHLGLPIVPFERLEDHYPPGEHDAFVALSSAQLNRVRMRLYRAVKQKGYTCASYVSSRAFVWHNATIGENAFVFENNVLQHQVSIGNNVVLWSGNHIGHRTVIHDHCFVTSHVVISGFCEVGESSFLGVNASLNDGIKVGNDCVVGAGAVVVKDLEPRGVYVGNPAKPTGKDSFESFGVPQQRPDGS
jgi:sugar O-acyltransferase (sialic acid O-acetyltransferase NeuD family)